MSRRAREEIPFGSDSFLDVLANIVGILIILIVAAAARMGRVPDLARAPQTIAAAAVKSTPPGPEQPPAPLEPQEAQPTSRSDTDEPPPEILAELRSLAGRVAALSDKSLAADARLKQLRNRYEAARQASNDEGKDAATRSDDLRAAQVRVARLEEALGERKQALTGLLAEFEEAQKAKPPAVQVRHRLAPVSQEIAGEELHFRVSEGQVKPPAVQVRHRLAPVSQEIAGEELHFRVSEGQVTVVPLGALVERVHLQLERQKDWLATRGRHEAVVGPVDGYSMSYLVEKKPLTALDRRRLGYGGYRIGITHWELIPEPDLTGETSEQALRRGSKFAMAVKTAPENAALTFWVYPDSFHAYRVLQSACQAEGFLVAGRPLPVGIRIAGSPEGTRSAGQ
jgi:hypothetical protein